MTYMLDNHSGLMRVGIGSTNSNSCLVQKACVLGWFWVEILIENMVRVGIGSTNSNSCLVRKACVLGWFCGSKYLLKIWVLGIPQKQANHFDPLPLHLPVTHVLSTRDQHRGAPPLSICWDEGPPPTYPPTLIPRLPPILSPPLACPPVCWPPSASSDSPTGLLRLPPSVPRWPAL
jgi:hypothetical protein